MRKEFEEFKIFSIDELNKEVASIQNTTVFIGALYRKEKNEDTIILLPVSDTQETPNVFFEFNVDDLIKIQLIAENKNGHDLYKIYVNNGAQYLKIESLVADGEKPIGIKRVFRGESNGEKIFSCMCSCGSCSCRCGCSSCSCNCTCRCNCVPGTAGAHATTDGGSSYNTASSSESIISSSSYSGSSISNSTGTSMNSTAGNWS